MDYEVKFKRVDTGKFWGAGKLKEGKFGPQIGMKMSPELRAYLDSVQEGGWLNFSLYEPREKAAHSEAKANACQPQDDDQSIPF